MLYDFSSQRSIFSIFQAIDGFFKKLVKNILTLILLDLPAKDKENIKIVLRGKIVNHRPSLLFRTKKNNYIIEEWK